MGTWVLICLSYLLEEWLGWSLAIPVLGKVMGHVYVMWRGEAVGRFKQFEKMWGTKHLSLATKVKCYKAYVLPILLFGSECWSLTKVQSQKLERVHSSCLRSILGVRLSDRHTNEHIRKSCGVATLSAYITANRLRWLGHVGRMEEGRLPHIALFS